MMNFKLPKKEYPEDSFLHKIQLMDVEDFHVFYNKLTLYYVELPKIDHVKLDLNTPLGRWFHALNNLYFYDRKPQNLKEPVFDKLFRQAELAQLTPDQDLAYERSMKVYLDTINQIRGARILGREDGLAEGKELGLVEGKELGLAEGEMKAKLETAGKMLAKGIEMETIREVTSLSEEQMRAVINKSKR